MSKILIFTFLFLFNFLNNSYASISASGQKNLIGNKIIYEGLMCNKLLDLLGGERKLDLLWLGNKKEEENTYVLINSREKSDYKIFYICK